MAETHAKQRKLCAKLADHIVADPRLFRRAGPGRDADPVRLQIVDLIDRNLVIAENAHVRP